MEKVNDRRYQSRYTSNELDVTTGELLAALDNIELSLEDKIWLRRLILLRMGIIRKTARECGVLDDDSIHTYRNRGGSSGSSRTRRLH